MIGVEPWPRTTIVTTCKGRLAHLTLSVATWLDATPCPILVVGDGCPELSLEFPQALIDPRLKYRATRAEVHDHFSKPRALNFGGAYAETEHLLFLDCDTLLMHRFWPWYSRRVAEDVMFIVPPSPDRRDLTGVLGVSRADFLSVEGADEGMLGWGSEDLDLRLRIYLARRPRIIEIPTDLITSIPHDDARRTRYYEEQDKMASHQRNLQRLVDNAERLTGQSIWSLLSDPAVKRMFGSGLGPEKPDGETRRG